MKKQTPDTIAKRLKHPNVVKSLFKVGHQPSAETRKKMSDAAKNRVPWNKGIPHSEQTRLKLKLTWVKNKEKRTGLNHWAYIKDRSTIDLNKRKYWASDYKAWKMTIFTRDSFKCKIDNDQCDGKIEAHHILSWTSHPDLRFTINNGITLCQFHHPRRQKDVEELSPYFQKLVAEK